MAAAPRILLTGFESFGGETVNPSWLVAKQLHGEVIAGAHVVACRLPCVFGDAIEVLTTAVGREHPRLVLALGQAGGRAELTPERIAVNVDDARIADNAGRQPVDRPVVAGGPAAYFATVPVKAMVAAMRDAGLPSSLSHSAGTFVCNHVFYGLMHLLRRRRAVRGGFMHLPLLPQQTAAAAAAAEPMPSLALAQQVAGVRLALQAAMTTAVDLHTAEGSVS